MPELRIHFPKGFVKSGKGINASFLQVIMLVQFKQRFAGVGFVIPKGVV
jgi:hypothetical protein